jgi:hypothetical protein
MSTEPIKMNLAEQFGSVIIEPREHPALKFVVHYCLERTPIDSYIIIFHGTKNGPWAQNLFTDEEKQRLIFKSCGKPNLKGPEYNALLKSKAFWNQVPFSKVLIFQTDSIILSKDRNAICQYFKYPYIGAPWRDGRVGNGGFSLRDKKFCLNVIKHKKMSNINEDVWFSSVMYDPKHKLMQCPSNVAKAFSVETVYYPTPFAIHNCWKYLSKPQMAQLVQSYPEIGTLMSLQKHPIPRVIQKSIIQTAKKRPVLRRPVARRTLLVRKSNVRIPK